MHVMTEHRREGVLQPEIARNRGGQAAVERPVSEADAASQHQRFLRRLFERQEELDRAHASALSEGLAQRLVGALLHLQTFQQCQEFSATHAEKSFRVGLRLLQEGIREAGQIARQLRPPTCDDDPVAVNIEALIHEAQRSSGPKIALRVEGNVGRFAPAVELALFRIASELLGNACRHSGSENVRVTVARTGEHLRLELEDWGQGFDPAGVNGTTFGLEEVRQRAGLLGGEIALESAPGKGTRVVVNIPIDHE
jgi:signal transduction histidine kinase